MDRYDILRRFISLAFLPLFLGLVYLQVFSYHRFRGLSESQSIRTIYLDIPRGRILDRNGRPMAADRIGFNLAYVPHDVTDPSLYAEELEPLLGQPAGEIRQLLARSFVNPFEPQVLRRDLGVAQLHLLEEQLNRLKGIFIQPGLIRDYPLGEHAAVLVGYLGEINQRELDVLRFQGIRAGDLVGRGGIESVYDALLRGERGGTQVEVDARGRQLRVIRQRDSKPGHTVTLSIDSRLQEIASRHLGNRSGSVVAVCPNTGQVLALASKPGFDPDRPAAALNHPGNPFINRAIQGEYPPGSVFKIVTAMAALESGVVKTLEMPDPEALGSLRSPELRRALFPADIIYCGGATDFGDRRFHCWKEEGHGWLAFKRAMAQSCNIYFGQVGIWVGEHRLLEYARKAGLGVPTGIELPGEKRGLVPAPGVSGGALNLSIGQGALLVTPIQLAYLAAMIANGGNIMQPMLVLETKKADGIPVTRHEPTIKGYFFLAQNAMEALRDSLREVITAGTGYAARVPGRIMGGKTGTAQVAQRGTGSYSRANFACWVEDETRPLAVATVLEKAQWGAEAAALTGAILREYYALAETGGEEEELGPGDEYLDY